MRTLFSEGRATPNITVDVIDLDGSSLVVCSTEVTPDRVVDTLGPAIEDGVLGLKQYCESRG